MKLIVCSSKDTMIGAHMALFTAHNEADAKRNWGGAIAYESSKEQTDPKLKDLQLFKIADYDDESGIITPDYKFIANAAEFMKQGEKKEWEDFTATKKDQAD